MLRRTFELATSTLMIIKDNNYEFRIKIDFDRFLCEDLQNYHNTWLHQLLFLNFFNSLNYTLKTGWILSVSVDPDDEVYLLNYLSFETQFNSASMINLKLEVENSVEVKLTGFRVSSMDKLFFMDIWGTYMYMTKWKNLIQENWLS